MLRRSSKQDFLVEVFRFWGVGVCRAKIKLRDWGLDPGRSKK